MECVYRGEFISSSVKLGVNTQHGGYSKKGQTENSFGLKQTGIYGVYAESVHAKVHHKLKEQFKSCSQLFYVSITQHEIKSDATQSTTWERNQIKIGFFRMITQIECFTDFSLISFDIFYNAGIANDKNNFYRTILLLSWYLEV